MNKLLAVAPVKSSIPRINNHKTKSLESIEKELKLKTYNEELREIDIKINNEILMDSSNKELDLISFLKQEKEKYGYHGKRNYTGLDFAIEFCNSNFISVTKLEKLYLDKLYLYAEFHEILFENIDDSELLGYLYLNSIDKKNVAINLKKYIDTVIYSIKNNQYNIAIDQIKSMSNIMSKPKIKAL